ncbi:MAG: hypothetical protein FJ206_15565 [Gemmatimonadetes bacterium]|nr:hypothetical protein [Gemmatimonadota bacterium]
MRRLASREGGRFVLPELTEHSSTEEVEAVLHTLDAVKSDVTAQRADLGATRPTASDVAGAEIASIEVGATLRSEGHFDLARGSHDLLRDLA